MQTIVMSTNSMSSIVSITETPVSSNRSIRSASPFDMNHNNCQKFARKRRITYTTDPIEHQYGSQSTSTDNSTQENASQASDRGHERQTRALNLDGETSANKHSSRPKYSQLRWLNLGNVCKSSKKSRQPVIVLDQMTMKRKIRVIDYGTWRWQPMLRLDKLTDDDLKNVDRSMLQSNPSARSHINPIKFDKDEELIRELSPDTAIERFQKVFSFLLPSI